MIGREAIYSALFTLVSGVADFKTASRKLIAAQDVAPESCPAIFQLQNSETAQVSEGAPNRWLLDVSLVIYVNVGNQPNTSPSSALNPILDAITSVIEPTPTGGRQTLGGLVRYAKVSGTIEIDEALLGDRAIAIIPVEILTERDWSVQPT